ncbi:Probable epoxide hydrolase EphC [Mycobacteroides abscessus subsp. bolletii]|nr:epoxide hydrolase EphC [Mycobacteroides abscessus subsp. bolletii]SKS88824.1 epoxide hydrolase EphC [Mycobacteroides abscessus subsp. bolletii]SKT11808.1 epoxide hydrolase EphC [Mycobacteroides abscessus subsp. bolletii]SLD07304.1 Probable epoxide hydrolase EphC [Mycobacteroides abscessus subsp. bolletii]SLF29048.1 Probable epoxide hydrolase EphC [Mycobacteroides abscessus subsp. bolletii]
MTSMEQSVTFGPIRDASRPLAVLVHGFPDTPNTWRHLGPQLADYGYRVAAPWLPGYRTPAAAPISVGTYVRHILDVHAGFGGDDRAVLIGHDWGANAGYGAVNFAPEMFGRFVSLAIPPIAALGAGLFSYAQVRRSFYIWFIQQVGLAEMALLEPGFWESLWADWSPGFDATGDIAELRKYVTGDTIAGVINPYRASFNPDFADPTVDPEVVASMAPPSVPTLYLHGRTDGAMGSELVELAQDHLPAPGSRFELLDDVGHFLHLEDPDLIWRRIRSWLPEPA